MKNKKLTTDQKLDKIIQLLENQQRDNKQIVYLPVPNIPPAPFPNQYPGYNPNYPFTWC